MCRTSTINILRLDLPPQTPKPSLLPFLFPPSIRSPQNFYPKKQSGMESQMNVKVSSSGELSIPRWGKRLGGGAGEGRGWGRRGQGYPLTAFVGRPYIVD